MSEQDTQRAEPVAWYMHLWNEADEDVKSEIRWGQPSAADIERAEHNGHDIEHLYAGPAPAAPAMTEQNKQSDTAAPEAHSLGVNLTNSEKEMLILALRIAAEDGGLFNQDSRGENISSDVDLYDSLRRKLLNIGPSPETRAAVPMSETTPVSETDGAAIPERVEDDNGK